MTTKHHAKSAHPTTPSHILLQADWQHHRAGTVLPADPALITQLDHEGVKYRAATERDRALAGVA
jgi:hypothetical protein